MSVYPKIKLSEVLTHHQQYIEAPEARIYPKLSVKLYGKGVMLDTPADGTTLKMQRHQLAKAGQVILSEIWGKKGAIGFVPQQGEGALCTSHFFLFDLHKDRLDRRWLQAIFDANYLQDQLDAQAKGTTGYAAVRPKILLACEIPLPSLAEQWRVVMRIEELATQIREAYTLRKQAAEEAEALLTATLDRIFPETGKSQFQYQLVSDAIESHKQGYYSGGKPIEGAVKFARITDITDEGYLNYLSMPGISIEDSALESFRVCPNDFLFARTGGAGRFGLATEGLDCVFASYLIRFRFKSEYLPRFLHFYFRGRRFQNQIRSRIHGGVNQNVHAEDIKDATVPKISLAEQRRIVTELEAVQAEVDALKRLQTETATELDALLPAILDRAFKGEL